MASTVTLERELSPEVQTVQLLSAQDVAEILAVSVRTVWRLADAGRLHRVRLSPRTIRFTAASIVELLKDASSPHNDHEAATNGPVGKVGTTNAQHSE